MEDPKPTNNKTCSCRQKSDCPLNQNCLSEWLVCNTVVNTSTIKNYYGTCEKSLKERYNNHTSSLWVLFSCGFSHLVGAILFFQYSV